MLNEKGEYKRGVPGNNGGSHTARALLPKKWRTWRMAKSLPVHYSGTITSLFHHPRGTRNAILLNRHFFDVSVMSGPAAKRARRPGSRVTLQFTFEDDAANAAFKARLQRVKELLVPEGRPPLDNVGLMTRLFDLVEGQLSRPEAAEPAPATATQHFLPSAGMSTV